MIHPVLIFFIFECLWIAIFKELGQLESSKRYQTYIKGYVMFEDLIHKKYHLILAKKMYR